MLPTGSIKNTTDIIIFDSIYSTPAQWQCFPATYLHCIAAVLFHCSFHSCNVNIRSVPAGRLPRNKEVIFSNDLIDAARPVEEVEVTAIYRHSIDRSINIMHGFAVFSTVIEANYGRNMEDAHGDMELTDDNGAVIRQLSKETGIAERVFASISPSIYGHGSIKNRMALALFGDQAKDVGENHHIRGDINLLMIGVRRTAKSQFHKYVEKT